MLLCLLQFYHFIIYRITCDCLHKIQSQNSPKMWACVCAAQNRSNGIERATEWNKNRWQKRKNDERDRKKCVLHAEPVFVWLMLQMLFSLASSVFLSHKWVSVRFAMFVPSYFFHSIPRNVNHKFMWFSILVVLLHTHTKKCVVVTIA